MEARDISNTVDEGVNRLKTGAHEAMENCRGYIQDNPWLR